MKTFSRLFAKGWLWVSLACIGSVTAGEERGLRSAASSPSLTVAVDTRGRLMTSTDGSQWLPGDAGTVFSLYAVAFGNGTFVAVGNEGTVLTSRDGIHWSVQNANTDDRLRDRKS